MDLASRSDIFQSASAPQKGDSVGYRLFDLIEPRYRSAPGEME